MSNSTDRKIRTGDEEGGSSPFARRMQESSNYSPAYSSDSPISRGFPDIATSSSGEVSLLASKNKLLRAEVDRLNIEISSSKERSDSRIQQLEMDLNRTKTENMLQRQQLQTYEAQSQEIRMRLAQETEAHLALKRKSELQRQEHGDLFESTKRDSQREISELKISVEELRAQLATTTGKWESAKIDIAKKGSAMEEALRLENKERESLRSLYEQKVSSGEAARTELSSRVTQLQQETKSLMAQLEVANDQVAGASLQTERSFAALENRSSLVKQERDQLAEQLRVMESRWRDVTEDSSRMRQYLTEETEQVGEELRAVYQHSCLLQLESENQRAQYTELFQSFEQLATEHKASIATATSWERAASEAELNCARTKERLDEATSNIATLSAHRDANAELNVKLKSVMLENEDLNRRLADLNSQLKKETAAREGLELRGTTLLRQLETTERDLAQERTDRSASMAQTQQVVREMEGKIGDLSAANLKYQEQLQQTTQDRDDLDAALRKRDIHLDALSREIMTMKAASTEQDILWDGELRRGQTMVRNLERDLQQVPKMKEEIAQRDDEIIRLNSELQQLQAMGIALRGEIDIGKITMQDSYSEMERLLANNRLLLEEKQVVMSNERQARHQLVSVQKQLEVLNERAVAQQIEIEHLVSEKASMIGAVTSKERLVHQQSEHIRGALQQSENVVQRLESQQQNLLVSNAALQSRVEELEKQRTIAGAQYHAGLAQIQALADRANEEKKLLSVDKDAAQLQIADQIRVIGSLESSLERAVADGDALKRAELRLQQETDVLKDDVRGLFSSREELMHRFEDTEKSLRLALQREEEKSQRIETLQKQIKDLNVSHQSELAVAQKEREATAQQVSELLSKLSAIQRGQEMLKVSSDRNERQAEIHRQRAESEKQDYLALNESMRRQIIVQKETMDDLSNQLQQRSELLNSVRPSLYQHLSQLPK